MKTTITFLLLLTLLNAKGQETDVWRFGAHFGFQGNKAQLIGGDKMADSRFEQNNAGAAALSFFARYDYNQHWMLLTGFGLSSYGFSFSLAKSYALTNPDSRRMTLQSNIGIIEIPFMIHYEFDPNCKQVKWLVGAGFIQNLLTAIHNSGTYTQGSEAAAGVSYFTTNVTQSKALFPTLRLSVGREKMLKHGDIVNVSFMLNYGFTQNARATVQYHVDGKDYMHQYGNKGNYAGIRIAYYLAPFKNK